MFRRIRNCCKNTNRRPVFPLFFQASSSVSIHSTEKPSYLFPLENNLVKNSRLSTNKNTAPTTTMPLIFARLGIRANRFAVFNEACRKTEKKTTKLAVNE